MKKCTKTKPAERKPPVKIPLDFETAVEGLVAVKPRDVKAVAPKKKRRAPSS